MFMDVSIYSVSYYILNWIVHLGIYITFYGRPLLALFSDCGSFLPYSHILDNLNNQIGFDYSLS